MLTKKYKNFSKILFLLTLFISLYCILVNSTNNIYAHSEQTIIKNNNSQVQLLNSINKTENVVDIDTEGISNFTDVKYIDNSNYFLVNPKHAVNNTSDNYAGTCTTVAVQLLLGYHNYYSDRRLIPETGDDNISFLCENFGNLQEHPDVDTTFSSGQGRSSIGTDDGVYNELLDLTVLSGFPLIGQAIGLVTSAANRFIDKYATSIKDNVSITSGFFSKSIAQADIDAGKPIVLGYEPVFSDAVSYHVVVAYGYAKLDGVDGFIVHYGWGEINTHVWVPAAWFGFQIRMNVVHNHNLCDSGINIIRTYRKLNCQECGYSTIDDLYEVDSSGTQIIGHNYELSGNIVLPNTINNKIINSIASNSFNNLNSMSSITIPNSVTSIGNNAFENCYGLESVILPNNLTTISDSLFKGCSSLSTIIIPNSVNNIGISAFEGCSYLQSISLFSNITTIGSLAFKGCSSLLSISIPNSVTSISISAFEGCSFLQNITLSDNLITIGSSAFKGCSSLTNITLPNSVISIGDSAFENCSVLSSIIVEREVSEITSIGNNVFNGISSTMQITVPINRIAEYMNKEHWVSYKNQIVPNNNNFDEINLHCLVDVSVSTELTAGYNKIYKLNIECGKTYRIISPISIIMNIYDSSMSLLCSGEETINQYMSQGVYYVDLRYCSNSLSGCFSTNYKLRWENNGNELSFGFYNDIMNHLHKIDDSTYKNKSFYANNQGAGLYKFSLETSGNSAFPYGSIVIYTNSARTSILNRYSMTNDYVPAIANANESQMFVYLPNNSNYYIDVVLPNNNYSTLTLLIEKVEINNINYINNLASINVNILFDNQNTQSYFEEVTISHKSKIELDIMTNGVIQNTIPVYIFEKIIDSSFDQVEDNYYVTIKESYNIIPTNSCPVFTVVLEPGTYYFGYYNNLNNISINFALRRMVNLALDIDGTLVTDPAYNEGFVLGTEVTLNNGDILGNTITEGFTRNMYLMVENLLLQPISRLDYDWYSSNNNVAIVTDYGTVLAKNVDQDTQVTIYAVLKTDPSVVYRKTIIITKDTSTEQLEIDSTMTFSFSSENGEYKLELNSTNCPFPMIKYYSWQITVPSENNVVTMNNWGFITSNSVCTATIIGTYIINPRVIVTITLIITE